MSILQVPFAGAHHRPDGEVHRDDSDPIPIELGSDLSFGGFSVVVKPGEQQNSWG